MKKILLLIVAMLGIFLVKAQENNTADKQDAIRLVTKNSNTIGLTNDELRNAVVSDTYFDKISGARMIYLQQAFKSIPVYNQLLVLAFKNEQLVSKAGSFISSIEKKINIGAAVPSITAQSAVLAALSDRKLATSQTPSVISITDNGNKYEFGDMGISSQHITAQLVWVPIADGRKLQLAWQVYIIPVTTSDYWMVRVDAAAGNILGMDNYTVYCNWDNPATKDLFSSETKNGAATSNLFDFRSAPPAPAVTLLNSPSLVNNSSYRVIPYPAESPLHPGGAHTLVANPWSMAAGNATSLKWNSNGGTDYTITRGNNVWAQEDRNNNNGTGAAPAATSSPDPLIFDFTPNFTVTPTQTTPTPNQQFNTVNLFYWNNIAHDLTYLYGLDEASGNFQDNNQGRGGVGGDWVNADAQDGGGTNNANFSTPPDGQSGRMQMYLWNGNPQKDGDVDNGIVIHEFGHGISNRLTGGPSQSGCLSNAEQMGEGWADYYALMYTQNWATSNLNTGFSSPRGVGTYAIGQTPGGSGIRNQKYCTNFAINNQVYAAAISGESHNRGEVWCATLWDMTWNIINQVGSINPNLFDPTGAGGNSIALKLVTEGMKLQPCSPGFIDGRNGILQADQLLYGGAYECAIREAFRRRGMGAFASQGSSGSVTDQIADYTAGGATLLLTQNGMTQVPEGGFITYTNTITTTACAPLTNFLITDTLPTNVTWISGGNYNSANRVVSFPVSVPAAQSQDFVFTVQVNAGAYFPTVSLFEDHVTGPGIAPEWTTNSSTTANWAVSNARSHSSPNSYYSLEIDVTSDQKLYSTNTIALGPTPPPLSFWHWYSTESTYDGGVLEISTNGGSVWNDLNTHIIKNGYIGTMDGTTIIPGRRAWTGSSNNKFIETRVDLSTYANQNVKFRFRFISDVGTALEGWYVDDIAVKSQAVVEMLSGLFTSVGIKVATSDTITIITPPVTCANVAVNAQPANTNVCVGANATFTVGVDGTTPSIQWQVSTNGGASYTDIPGQTNPTLTLAGVTVGMNNNMYHVVVTNSCPSNIISDGATLTVSDPASITTQPANATTCEGSNASYSVSTTGSANTYQWQVSTDGGATFNDIPGATSATLNIPAVTIAMNNNQYHVVVSSCSPTAVTSANVTLTVNGQASITTQPSDVTSCQATDATFTVQTGGPGVTYQWQVSTDGGATFNDIPGANANTYTITGVTPSQNNNQYHVIIANSCTASVTSANVTLVVSNIASIITQPGSITACDGDATSFVADASGTGYQWQVSTDGGGSFTDIPGATSPTLNLGNVTPAMSGNQYHLIVLTCGPASVTSNNVTLTVNIPANITSQPTNSSVCDGSSTSFSVTATGTSPAYQWEVSTDGGVSFSPVPGAIAATLNLPAVTTAMNGYIYRVVVSNFCTVNFTSNDAILSVSAITVIGNQPADQTVCAGSDATYTATATGSGLNYQWQISTDGGATFTDLTGATNSTLTIVAVTDAMNNDRFRVIISGCNTLTSNDAVLLVNPLPTVTISVAPYENITPGQTTTLTATSTPPASGFAWYKNGTLVPSLTTSTITVTYADTGIYRASATDANGCSNLSNAIKIGPESIAFIFPNPNNGLFWVTFPGTQYNGKPRYITMYDGKGAKVYEKAFVTSTSYERMEVHAESLSNGVYALVLYNTEGTVLGKGKVLIQR